MAGFSYDPQTQYRGDAYTAQAGQALASDISNMFAQHHAQKLQDQLDQANAAKAKVTMDFLAKQPNAVSLEDMADFHDAAANGNYTKATKIAEGAAANFATSIALQHQAAQQPRYQYFQPPQGAPPGTPGVGALTAGENVHPIIPKPAPPPLGVQQVPVPGGGSVNVLSGGGVQTQVIKDANGKDKLELSPEEMATGASLGYKPLRQSNGSFVWEKDPTLQLKANDDAVKNFDAHIGKTYGVKSADIFNLNLTEPGAIKYEDAKGNALSTEQAAKAGYGATAVVPVAGEFSTKAKRIPLPEWNTIVNQWQQLPRAGKTGGVTVQGGSGNSLSNAPNLPDGYTATGPDGKTYKWVDGKPVMQQ